MIERAKLIDGLAARTSVAAGACALALVLSAGCGDTGDSAGGGGERPPASVAVAEARKMDLADTVRGIGTLHPKERVEIEPEVAGRVLSVSFDEGTQVREGQLLARLDARKIEAEVDARRAQLAEARVRASNAERRYARFEKIGDPAAVSRDEVDAAQTELEAARAEVSRLEAELARAEERLEDTQIRAPFTGAIGEALVDQGDYVEEGDAIATLRRIDVLELSFTLPERHRPRVAIGQDVDVELDAFGPDERFAGRVTFVDPAVNVNTRAFTVKADIDNPEGRLVPGSFARAELTLERLSDRVVVPEAALVATRSGYILFVVEDGVARQRSVTTGLRKPGLVEIREGVTSGETVVESGHMSLFEGAPVAVADGPSEGAAS